MYTNTEVINMHMHTNIFIHINTYIYIFNEIKWMKKKGKNSQNTPESLSHPHSSSRFI